MRRVIVGVFVGCGMLGCGLVVGLDHYRNCAGNECGASADGGAESGDDAGPLVACSASSDCLAAPGAARVCSTGYCRSILVLGQGASTHECVVLSDHTVRCWGENQDGQLGAGDSKLHILPPPSVLNETGDVLGDVVDVTLGWGHTCALTSKGEVYCWGKNDRGQLGLGDSVQKVSKATKVGGLVGRKAVQISTGLGGPVCALTDSGGASAVYCWGESGYGQLGDPAPDGGSVGPHFTPVLLPAPTDVKTIAAGAIQVCVQTRSETGKLTCWGDGWLGVLDNGSPTEDPSLHKFPARYPFQKNTFSVAANSAPIDEFRLGEEHICARIGTTMYCWGGDYFGMASAVGGNINYGPQWLVKPTIVKSVEAAGVSPAWRGTCALIAGGTIECWGMTQDNELGIQWGLPSVGPKPVPLVVDSKDRTVLAVALHVLFGCALTDDGKVYCWGIGGAGLGDGRLADGGGISTVSRIPDTSLPVAL